MHHIDIDIVTVFALENAHLVELRGLLTRLRVDRHRWVSDYDGWTSDLYREQNLEIHV